MATEVEIAGINQTKSELIHAVTTPQTATRKLKQPVRRVTFLQNPGSAGGACSVIHRTCIQNWSRSLPRMTSIMRVLGAKRGQSFRKLLATCWIPVNTPAALQYRPNIGIGSKD